jgi:hypothetical protein
MYFVMHSTVTNFKLPRLLCKTNQSLNNQNHENIRQQPINRTSKNLKELCLEQQAQIPLIWRAFINQSINRPSRESKK